MAPLSLSRMGPGRTGFHFVLLLSVATLRATDADDGYELGNGLGQPSESDGIPKSNLAPFKPSIAVIIGVLTTIFSVTFLLLLYVKHCQRGPHNGQNPNGFLRARHSGVDRVIIESLPMFRFESLNGPKNRLECAVCLNRFESVELLRLLPKCKHAFHVECVDTWLESHSTCPLCRVRVDPEDVLLFDESLQKQGFGDGESRLSSGRKSAGDIFTGDFLQVVVQKEGEETPRRSSDSNSKRKKMEFSDQKLEFSGHRIEFFGRKMGFSGDSVSMGCFDRGRKDGLLMEERRSFERRVGHRIIVSDAGFRQRWSDLRPSDLLFLRSEMILGESGRFSLSSRKQDERENVERLSLSNHNVHRRGEQGNSEEREEGTEKLSEERGRLSLSSLKKQRVSDERGESGRFSLSSADVHQPKKQVGWEEREHENCGPSLSRNNEEREEIFVQESGGVNGGLESRAINSKRSLSEITGLSRFNGSRAINGDQSEEKGKKWFGLTRHWLGNRENSRASFS
ncbi:hypothetical protein AMTRI_Chr12g274980 [Amborella trichopoda]